MKFYFIKTPKLIQQFYKNYVWRFSNATQSTKTLYLTFDDGPTPEITEWALNTLAEYNAKATFFCIGKNIKKHPKLFQQIINEGHAIGNHTHNHLNGWKSDTKNYVNNVLKTEEVISATLNQPNNQPLSTKLFRPPYGKIKSSQANILIKKGYHIIMWDVLSADFDKTNTPQQCAENVLSTIENGSIIIFHDSVKASKNLKFALPEVLKKATELGYTFKRIALPNE